MENLYKSLNYKPTELAFGTSGLRGLVADITDLETYINTRGFIEFMISEQQLAPGTEIYFAGDLRSSTPRILRSVYQAIVDSGFKAIFGGFVPTPAISYHALVKNAPSIMVTGSHIPDDRNGIKFNKLGGEVLKEDETAIKQAVANVRTQQYEQPIDKSAFNTDGGFKAQPSLPEIDPTTAEIYIQRYKDAFSNSPLTGKKIIFYEHSAVGRDMIPVILQSLGAIVESVDRSERFIPIDTENVTPDNQAYFKKLAAEHSDAFAIVSTDGDSDRPFVIDENGIFHRGDELGAVVAKWLGVDFAALPISSSDAVDKFLTTNNIPWEHTRIGSPYVISAMASHDVKCAVGWEVNGGFLLGSDINTPNGYLKALPTRDAVLPIIVSLISAVDSNQSLSSLFKSLPERYTQAGIIDNFPIENSRAIVNLLSGDETTSRQNISRFFNKSNGFDDVASINTLDGTRIFFDNGDVVHIRPSGNAPQLRVYSVSSTQQRADEIVALAIAEPNGILRTIEKSLN